MRVPENSNIQDDDQNALKQRVPKITTLVTYYHEESNKSFKVIRFDRASNKWQISKKESCFAWKWRKFEEKSELVISMERNLEIQDPNITDIVFLVSLPITAFKNDPEVVLQRYNFGSSIDQTIFNVKDHPSLQEHVGLSKTTANHVGTQFSPGIDLLPEISSELTKISSGNIQFDKDIKGFIQDSKSIGYQKSQDRSYCAIPSDLK